MIILGPIPMSSKDASSSPYFSLLLGIGGLAYVWIRYLRRDPDSPFQMWNLVWVSVVCTLFIAYGAVKLLSS